MIKTFKVEVAVNEYKYVTCTCGQPIMVWLDELVRHTPMKDECSNYLGVNKTTSKSQISLFGNVP
jgi:hypothetical protein